MKVIWNARALSEFEEGISRIRAENPDAAAKVAEAVLAAIDYLLDGRFDGPTVRLTDGREVMHWWVHPYHLFYVRRPGAVRILRVHHHARRPLWKP